MAYQSFEPQRIRLKQNFATLRFVPRFFREIRKVNPLLFYANLLCRLLSALLPISMLWVGKLIIDEIVLQINAEELQLGQLGLYIGLEFALAIASDLLSRLTTLSDSLLGDQYSIRSSVRIIRKTSELSISQLEDADFYDKLERARRQTTGRVRLMSSVLTQGQDLIVISSLLTGVVAFEPWLILLLVLSIVPTILNEIKFSGTSYSLTRSWTQERRELDYLRFVGASDVTAKEVKLFGLSDYLAERFRVLSQQYYKASKKLSFQRALWGSFFNIISTTAYYGAYVLIVLRTVGGLISIGDLTFLAGSFNRLRGKLQSLFTRFTDITEQALYLQDYFEFLDLRMRQQLEGHDESTTSPKRPLPEVIQEGFEFRNVGFKYPNAENWVLRDLNFQLRVGEKLALVGENGAGKSTLIKLLLQFYVPAEGEILLDGIPIQEFEPLDYHQRFGVIFQDFVRFDLTLRENIAVGEIEALDDQARIEAAAEKSLASEVIAQFSAGYDQKLGRRFRNGKNLSGGQWQKVALGRAYMKDAEVLILDEPTSALDARAESETFQRFISLTEGKTAVIISHRFSTVRIADRIMVLKNGGVLEMGTHDELMANEQLYAELFRLQAEGYQ